MKNEKTYEEQERIYTRNSNILFAVGIILFLLFIFLLQSCDKQQSTLPTMQENKIKLPGVTDIYYSGDTAFISFNKLDNGIKTYDDGGLAIFYDVKLTADDKHTYIQLKMFKSWMDVNGDMSYCPKTCAATISN